MSCDVCVGANGSRGGLVLSDSIVVVMASNLPENLSSNTAVTDRGRGLLIMCIFKTLNCDQYLRTMLSRLDLLEVSIIKSGGIYKDVS